MTTENRCAQLSCPAACCHDVTLDLSLREFKAFSEGLTDFSPQEVPLAKFRSQETVLDS